MSMTISALKPTTPAYGGFQCGNSYWTAIWHLTRQAAPTELGEADWEHGAYGGWGGFVVSAERALRFASAVEQLASSEGRWPSDILSPNNVRDYVAFLRASRGFKVH